MLAAAQAGAATPPPMPPPLVHPPNRAAHTEFIIEVNRSGQVSHVRSRKSSGDHDFDAVAFGNVVQTFVRRPNGRAVPGVYQMNYDYNPKTKNIRRTVDLLKAGGVKADAPGLVDQMAESNRRSLEKLRKAMEAEAKHPAAPAKGAPRSPAPKASSSP